MKSASASYIAQETGKTRRPIELFHLWCPGMGLSWRYTSGDAAVSFGGHTYNPAAIERGAVGYDSDLSTSTLELSVARVEDPAVRWVTANPVEEVWIEVFRIFADQAPQEAGVIFLGLIDTVTLSGPAAQVNCVGFEKFLDRPLPVFRFQPQCNWTLGDARCGVSLSGLAVDAAGVTVSADRMSVAHADFSAFDDGYFLWGYLYFAGVYRMIVYHDGSDIGLRYPMPDLASGDSVTAYPGCDGALATCTDKFSNSDNFGGHPYVPLDNPATWRG